MYIISMCSANNLLRSLAPFFFSSSRSLLPATLASSSYPSSPLFPFSSSPLLLLSFPSSCYPRLLLLSFFSSLSLIILLSSPPHFFFSSLQARNKKHFPRQEEYIPDKSSAWSFNSVHKIFHHLVAVFLK
jgi:hypothetical protein